MSDWIILKCTSGKTLRLTETLGAAGYMVWTPIKRETIRRARWNVKRNVAVPLAAGLIFARSEHMADFLDFARMPVKPRFATGFKDVLRDPMVDGVPMIRDSALDPLRLAELPAKVRRRAGTFSRGDGVKVLEGSFAGFPAIVDTSDRRNTKVWITLFGRHQRVELPSSILRLDEVEGLRSETGTAVRKAA